jgi:carboxymethylenebutenolidase
MAGESVRAGRLSGWYAAPEDGRRGPGVIVLMEAFGLTPHIQRVCERLAAAGYPALAPDLYGGKTYGYDQMTEIKAAISALNDGVAMGQVGAWLDWLETQPAVRPGKSAVLGFCMGGRLAFLSACRHAMRLGAAACFYGGGIFPEGNKDRLGRTPPIGEAASLKSPLLLVYGSADQGIPPDEHGRLAQRLGELGKRYTMSLYPDAGHGFCCEDRDSHAPAATEAAFAETFEFFRRTLS